MIFGSRRMAIKFVALVIRYFLHNRKENLHDRDRLAKRNVNFNKFVNN